MNIDIFIPARLSSSRLPKKHLEKINDLTIIENIVNRLKTCENYNNIVVCTTTDKSDDSLVNFLKTKNILFFRGDKCDILARFLAAAKKFESDVIIDVEGDKLFIEPQFVNDVIRKMYNENVDFVIGSNSPTNFDPNDHFVHGLIPTGIRVSCIQKISDANKSKNKETGYKEFFVNNSNIKKIFYVLDTHKFEISKNLRLTIDYPEDLKFARALFKLLPDNFNFTDILVILKKYPDLLNIIKNLHEHWINNYNKEIEKS